MRIILSALAGACLATSAVCAEPAAPDAKALIDDQVMKDIRSWIDTEIVRLSITTQNQRYGDIPQSRVEELDKMWRAEREADDKPLISATLSNPLSVYLSRMQGRSVGLFVEIFVMDDKGLNVGQSSITSDFWQGDEAKFQKTYPKGAGAVFIDEPEWDDDFKIWRAQINMTVEDADGSTPIGAATIEVNLTELQRRQSVGS
ncbi:hypothetical protein GR183_03250 [Stappia sp. GBMRC 2046]|uniref:DUF3251 domain-containing protein n=1 Tax=Stappia sediminis TaxID=2692190 RepID=A0A7X3LRS7_9HYPH|nr:hypothetical protein [Stappia sediminis]MXN63909.1 hypothetical protein [Stappia sediminis]